MKSKPQVDVQLIDDRLRLNATLAEHQRQNPPRRLRLRALLTLAWFSSATLCTQAFADARVDYLLHCGGCHLADGSGDPPEVPSLRVHVDRFASFEAGRAYLTQVPGAAQVPISDARLAAVLNWVLDNFYRDHKVQPFAASEVAALRGNTLLDPLAERDRLLELLAEPAPSATRDQIPAEKEAPGTDKSALPRTRS